MALFRKRGLFESNRVVYLPITALEPNPAQPRKVFSRESLEELSASIAAHGILQPLSVRRTDKGYELISGERRLRAADLCGLHEVPCIVVQAGPQESSLLALIENIQRRDLDFWEEALALQALLDTAGLSQEALARQIGKSQSAVANKLRLLKLSPAAVETLRKHGLTERHARALLKLPNSALQDKAALYVTNHNLTVAQTESYVESLLHPAVKPRKPIVILKDVRLFLNTVTKGLKLMQTAGIQANCDRQDLDNEILLTIHIPR